MSPHRVLPAAGLLKSPLALVQSVDPTGVVCAGAVACASWFLGNINAALILVVAGAIAADISSGSLLAYLDPHRDFTRARLVHGAVTKLLQAHLIAIGLVVDWTVILGLPDAGEVVHAWMPMTRLGILVLIGSEASSAIRNIGRVISIPAALRSAVTALQSGDARAALAATDTPAQRT